MIYIFTCSGKKKKLPLSCVSPCTNVSKNDILIS